MHTSGYHNHDLRGKSSLKEKMQSASSQLLRRSLGHARVGEQTHDFTTYELTMHSG